MRVFVADDQVEVRSALRLALEEEGFEVVGEAGSGARLIRDLRAGAADVLLLDWELPGPPADRLLPALRRRLPQLCVVALSGRPEAASRALSAGVDLFVSKSDPPERLLALVRAGFCRHTAP